jgi:hypothetical protein
MNMPHPSNPFYLYAEQAGSVAREMLDHPDNSPATFGNDRPGSPEIFKWAGNYVHLQTIRRLEDTVPEILKRRNVLYGMRVMSCFVLRAATRAHTVGLKQDTFLAALTHPATFPRTLGLIATQDKRVAEGLEHSYGLSGPSSQSSQAARYAFEADGGISLDSFDLLASLYRGRLEAQGEIIRDDAICAAHRVQALEEVFHAVVPVYATHPALGGAIFSETKSIPRPTFGFTPQTT